MAEKLTTCIGCGCTEMTPCEVNDGTCAWLERDEQQGVGVCTACPEAIGLFLIAQERLRQINQEGYDADHDDEHTDASLALAAAWYAAPYDIYRIKESGLSDEIVEVFPESWEDAYDKKELHGRVKQLQIAGALIAAELDRLYRLGERR